MLFSAGQQSLHHNPMMPQAPAPQRGSKKHENEKKADGMELSGESASNAFNAFAGSLGQGGVGVMGEAGYIIAENLESKPVNGREKVIERMSFGIGGSNNLLEVANEMKVSASIDLASPKISLQKKDAPKTSSAISSRGKSNRYTDPQNSRPKLTRH